MKYTEYSPIVGVIRILAALHERGRCSVEYYHGFEAVKEAGHHTVRIFSITAQPWV